MLTRPGRSDIPTNIRLRVPPAWKRQFPVFGAVSGTIGCLAAMEAIKLVAGFGECLLGRMLLFDLRHMTVRSHRIHRREDCEVCGEV